MWYIQLSQILLPNTYYILPIPDKINVFQPPKFKCTPLCDATSPGAELSQMWPSICWSIFLKVAKFNSSYSICSPCQRENAQNPTPQ